MHTTRVGLDAAPSPAQPSPAHPSPACSTHLPNSSVSAQSPATYIRCFIVPSRVRYALQQVGSSTDIR